MSLICIFLLLPCNHSHQDNCQNCLIDTKIDNNRDRCFLFYIHLQRYCRSEFLLAGQCICKSYFHRLTINIFALDILVSCKKKTKKKTETSLFCWKKIVFWSLIISNTVSFLKICNIVRYGWGKCFKNFEWHAFQVLVINKTHLIIIYNSSDNRKIM